MISSGPGELILSPVAAGNKSRILQPARQPPEHIQRRATPGVLETQNPQIGWSCGHDTGLERLALTGWFRPSSDSQRESKGRKGKSRSSKDVEF